MEADLLKTLADLGGAGVSIIMAVIFIKYIQGRDKASELKDKEWQMIMGNHMSEEIKAFTALTEKINDLREDIKK